MSAFTLIENLPTHGAVPPRGIHSQTLYQDAHAKVVWFGMAAGEELSEHTAAVPAVMHFLSGEADVTLGGKPIRASAGTWVHMPAQLPHSIRTHSPVVMLLTLFKGAA